MLTHVSRRYFEGADLEALETVRSVMTERVRAGLVSKYSWPKEAAAWVLRSGLNPFALIWNDMSTVSPDQARPPDHSALCAAYLPLTTDHPRSSQELHCDADLAIGQAFAYLTAGRFFSAAAYHGDGTNAAPTVAQLLEMDVAQIEERVCGLLRISRAHLVRPALPPLANAQ